LGCNPENGISFKEKQEALLFWKWVYFKNGISTREFKREQIRDIRDVMDIDNAIQEKKISQKKLQDLINSSQMGF